MTAGGEPTGLWAEIPGVLRAWRAPAPASVARVPGGTLNWNFELRFEDGQRRFLRCYRSNLETERIRGEHTLVRWVADADARLPVPVPIVTAQGDTLELIGERRWALFPWMPGAPVQRGTLSSAQAHSLGDAHGRIQAILATHPESAAARLSMRWGKTESLDLLDRLVATAEKKRVPDWIRDGMVHQRHLLEATDVWPPERFASLPCQLLHGDFHDQQVLFLGDVVSAIVDWEIWHTDPRAWELVRSLAFSTLLGSPMLEDYLAGYREHIRLSEDEVALALRLWFQSRLVGVWAWWAYLMEGNERVEAFFPEMITELDRVTDRSWTEPLAVRFVRAACG